MAVKRHQQDRWRRFLVSKERRRWSHFFISLCMIEAVLNSVCQFTFFTTLVLCVAYTLLDNLLVRVPDLWLKGCEFESWQERRENFLLQSQLGVLIFIQCLFLPHVTTVARKRSRSICQKCRWQVTPKQAYTLDPMKSEWADYAAVQALSGNLSGNKLTRSLSGSTPSQSSQLAEPLWTDPGLKSGISVHELISTLKKKKA